MQRKYLDDLGITERPDTWNPDDSRQNQWEEQRKIYGFDERETWSLETAFYLWLYERLKMYLEYTIVDLDFYKFEYKGKTYTQKQMIDMMIERLKEYLTDETDEKSFEKYPNEICEIWALVLPVMCW